MKKFSSNCKGLVVCLCSLVLTTNRAGFLYSFGFFVAEFYKLYNTSMTTLTWISVMTVGLGGLISPLVSYFIKWWGRNGYWRCALFGVVLQSGSLFLSSMVDDIRWMFLSYGVLYGVGYSFTYLASSLVLCEFFPVGHRYHMVSTVTYWIGYPLGSMIYNPITAFLIKRFAWRTTLVIHGCGNLIMGILASLSFSLDSKDPIEPIVIINISEDNICTESSSKPDSQQVCPDKNVEKGEICEDKEIKEEKWKSISGYTIIVFWLITSFNSYVIFTFVGSSLPHYLITAGISEITSSVWILSANSLQIAIYIWGALLAHYYLKNLIYAEIFAGLWSTFVFITWCLMANNINFAAVMTIAYCSVITLCFIYIYPASAQITGFPISTAWYLTNFFGGIGTLAGPLFTGVIYDIRQRYSDVFIALSCVGLTNFILFVGIFALKKWKRV